MPLKNISWWGCDFDYDRIVLDELKDEFFFTFLTDEDIVFLANGPAPDRPFTEPYLTRFNTLKPLKKMNYENK